MDSGSGAGMTGYFSLDKMMAGGGRFVYIDSWGAIRTTMKKDKKMENIIFKLTIGSLITLAVGIALTVLVGAFGEVSDQISLGQTKVRIVGQNDSLIAFDRSGSGQADGAFRINKEDKESWYVPSLRNARKELLVPGTEVSMPKRERNNFYVDLVKNNGESNIKKINGENVSSFIVGFNAAAQTKKDQEFLDKFNKQFADTAANAADSGR